MLDKEKLDVIKSIILTFASILDTSSGTDGRDLLSADIMELAVSSKVAWWEFYEYPEKLRKSIAFALLDQGTIRQVQYSVNPRVLFTDVISGVAAQLETDASFRQAFTIHLGSSHSPAGSEYVVSAAECETRLGLFVVSIIGNLYNYLALMVCGRSICSLVADAKSGDDSAFWDAIHIDKTVLNLPNFKEKLVNAQLEGNEAFFRHLATVLKRPLLQSRITLRKLFLAFAVLEDEGLLDTLKHDELLDICREVGAYETDDVGNFRKHLRAYRSKRGRHLIN